MERDPLQHTIHLQSMAYTLSLIGRVKGSTCEPWIPTIPDGRWTFLDMNMSMLRRYCALLGCTPSELTGINSRK